MENTRHIFRVWNTSTNTWETGTIMATKNGELVSFSAKEQKILDRKIYIRQECTGLKDKNGVLIFEGDILSKDCYMWMDEGKQNYVAVVEWIYSCWQVVAECVNPNRSGISSGINQLLNEDGFEEDEHSDWEVIGNTFDNSDLLLLREKEQL